MFPIIPLHLNLHPSSIILEALNQRPILMWAIFKQSKFCSPHQKNTIPLGTSMFPYLCRIADNNQSNRDSLPHFDCHPLRWFLRSVDSNRLASTTESFYPLHLVRRALWFDLQKCPHLHCLQPSHFCTKASKTFWTNPWHLQLFLRSHLIDQFLREYL